MMTKKKKTHTQKLQLKGKTAVFIDWANVYGWQNVLERSTDPKSLFRYLKTYPEIKTVNFYFGTDVNKKSKAFLYQAKKIGFTVVTKPVKYILLGNLGGQLIRKRKCDFDIEICMSVYEHLEDEYESFVFFSGDGDFAPLYEYLIRKHKQVIVVYAKQHIGREIWDIKKGLFKIKIDHLGL